MLSFIVCAHVERRLILARGITAAELCGIFKQVLSSPSLRDVSLVLANIV